MSAPTLISPLRWVSLRRIASLGRAEALLLRRNPIALLNAVAMPIILVLFFKSAVPGGAGHGTGAGIATSLTAFTLLLVVYYNLVPALVARREELVLKRLRTGESTDAEILTGTALPAVALAWGQILIGVIAAATVFGMGVPTNPVLVLLALALGTPVFVLLAAASTAMTRNVEMAQVTTAPVLIVPLLFSGLVFRVHDLPLPLQYLAQALPLTPVVDLLHLGLTGTTRGGASVGTAGSFGPAVVPVLVLIAWVLAGGWATQRWLRWEPRR
ncbi:MAG: ABC transporter permease [Pseudonocardiales bacterium]